MNLGILILSAQLTLSFSDTSYVRSFSVYSQITRALGLWRVNGVHSTGNIMDPIKMLLSIAVWAKARTSIYLAACSSAKSRMAVRLWLIKPRHNLSSA